MTLQRAHVRFVAALGAIAVASASAAESHPGAPPFTPALAAEIEGAVSDSQPRPPYTNRLILSASPYLRMHAHNPVDWFAYGPEAFAAAERLDRPLFVSIGYATCHWCAVMEEESYRDPEVGAALNASFVAVKVDREAQPEVAEGYARIVGAMGERVGWPLHVFLLPDGTPFHAATYIPRRDRPGRPGILAVLASVRQALEDGSESLARRGRSLREQVQRQLVTAAPVGPAASVDAALLRGVRDAGFAAFDAEWGGRASLPKRSADPLLPWLLRYARRSGDDEARELSLHTLEQMARAPVRAQDGGFFEGANDRGWSKPRAERRLADNALLALTYLEGWQSSGRTELREVAREVLSFISSALAAPEGAFFASLRDGAEGRQVDRQVLAGANGLAISALARGGFALDAPRFVARARAAARFVLDTMQREGRLYAVHGAGRLGPAAGLNDHALVIAGLLDLFEVDADERWLSAALALQQQQDERFADGAGGYTLTEAPPGPGLARPKHARDGAVPAGNAVAAWNLLRLHALTAESATLDRCDALLAFFAADLRADPVRHAGLASALDARLDGLHEVVLVVPPGTDAEPMLAPMRARFVPNRVFVLLADPDAGARLASLARLVKGKRPLGGGPTAYVCRDQVCSLPARSPDVLTEQLLRFTPL